MVNPEFSKKTSAQENEIPDSFYRRYGKRLFDFSLAFVGLLFLGIPMLLVSLIIYLVDGTPALFKQQRVGLNAKVFTIRKYRTMRNRPQEGSTITVAGDQRVSPLGAFLRRYKIDELPQLINVLKGEMSFVGPRPDMPGYADQLKGDERLILSIRPGITSMATLKYRKEEEILASVPDPQKYNDEVIYPDKVRLNLDYAKTLSLQKDVECILSTIFGN